MFSSLRGREGRVRDIRAENARVRLRVRGEEGDVRFQRLAGAAMHAGDGKQRVDVDAEVL